MVKSQKFGGEKRIAAYLKFNVPLGATFTMRDLRTAIAPAKGRAADAEQLNQRLRNLRPDGWVITS